MSQFGKENVAFWARMRQRIGEHRPQRRTREGDACAAVALVMRPSQARGEILLIRRAQRAGDPWSGQMAFPGGRGQEEDRDALDTALRETREEVGIDLSEKGRLIGALDEIRAVGGGRELGLVIFPFVFELREEARISVARDEVDAVLWVPFDVLLDPAAEGRYQPREYGGGMSFPAFRYEGEAIWGLTHRMIINFLEVAGARPRP